MKKNTNAVERLQCTVESKEPILYISVTKIMKQNHQGYIEGKYQT